MKPGPVAAVFTPKRQSFSQPPDADAVLILVEAEKAALTRPVERQVGYAQHQMVEVLDPQHGRSPGSGNVQA